MASANKLLHIYYASITTYLNLKTQAGTWSHTNHFFGRLPFQIWIAQQSGFMWPFSLIRNLEISTWLLLAGLFVAKLVSVVGSEMALKSRNINHLKHQIHWGTRLWGVYLFRQRKTCGVLLKDLKGSFDDTPHFVFPNLYGNLCRDVT